MPFPGTRPLSIAEMASLEQELSRVRLGPAAPIVLGRGYALIEVFYYTGLHPESVAHPSRWGIDLQSDGQLALTRPKNHELVYIPVDPLIRPWLMDLLTRIEAHGYSPTRLNQLVHAAGRTIGFPDLTPRGLRHSFGYRAWLKYRDPNLVARWMGCSIAVVFSHYVNAELGEHKLDIISHGWGRAEDLLSHDGSP